MKIIYEGKQDTRLFKNMIGETIEKIMEADDKVVWLDADLMGCSGTGGKMGKDRRYINCGIAEANMIGVGCGMSAAGLKPYAHSFGPFASRRCYDQAFLSGGYAKNQITIIGTDPGITAAFNGGTHMPFEDIALYRAMPEAVVVDATDIPMLEDILWKAKDMPGVKYIRVPRKNPYQVYEDGAKFTVGKGVVVRDGKDAVVVACGIMVHEALQAAKLLERDGICAAVIDPFTIKPLDRELIRRYVEKTGAVVTAENHNKIGGLRDAVLEAIAGMPCSFGCVAVEDTFGEVGPQDYLHVRFGLTSQHIAEKVKVALVGGKKS